jgi:O-antigen ligase
VAAGWCVLALLWFVAAWLDPAAVFRLGWTELAGGALVLWHSVAALVWMGDSNDRQTLNALWLGVGYGLTVLIFRQAVRTSPQVKATIAAMLWLAVLLSAFGLYQYFILMPALRQEYAANPEQVLIANGIDADSPQRMRFENRLESVEPLGTFALTNSLAGYLAPWLIVALAIVLAALAARQADRSLYVAVLAAVLLTVCLLLTKSRTGYLAALVGVVLLGLYGRGGRWSVDWRIPTLAAATLLLVGLAVVAAGGLDVEVLSEAPKSVLYRLEYWQSTAAMIADHPLFGAGSGNFQTEYPAYKLPQASENIADPHNFLLEIWATAGTPAIVLVLLLMVAFVADLVGAARSSKAESRADPDAASARIAARPILIGAACGLLLAALVAAIVGHPLARISPALPLPVVWLLGFPLLALVAFGMWPWIDRGDFPLAGLVVPIIVLLVNLLAAGAVTFPGVMSTPLVLVPLAVVWAEIGSREPRDASRIWLPREFRLSRAATAAGLFVSVALSFACLRTEYQPVLAASALIREARESSYAAQASQAIATAQAAAAADPYSPEPWRLLADLHLHDWLASGDKQDWEQFVSAANLLRIRNPRQHLDYYNRGDWYLMAWRRSGRPEDRENAIKAYRQAIDRYPNRALYHAQLAWVLHLAERPGDARKAAERAKQLDDLNPHLDQKLSVQHLVDPRFSAEGVALARTETAEQTVERLRTATGENSPQ